MRRRFRRRDRDDSAEGGQSTLLGRVPAGVYWTIMAFIVLGLVVTYSNHEEKEGMSHSETGKALEKRGVYPEAITEYRKTLDNPAVGRKDRSDAAVRIANVYFDHFDEYGPAYEYYVRAKQLAPKLFEDKELARRMKTARQLSSGSGAVIGSEGTTPTVIQRVALQTQPMEDRQGPVVARFKGTEIHTGELARALRSLPDTEIMQMKSSPQRLEKWVKDYVEKSLLYRAATDANYQRNPDISAQLYDYQRAIIAERYARDLREKAGIIPNADVETYYNENIAKYRVPGHVVLAEIKTDDEKKAAAAQEALRKGASFGDAVTSYSVDVDSTRTKGIIGRVNDADGFIPGLGHKPELVKQLMGLKVNDRTSPTEIGGHYFIFQVIEKDEGTTRSLDEMRTQIESILRSRKTGSTTGDLVKNLRAEYGVEMDGAGLSQIWETASHNPGILGEGSTTATAVQPAKVQALK